MIIGLTILTLHFANRNGVAGSFDVNLCFFFLLLLGAEFKPGQECWRLKKYSIIKILFSALLTESNKTTGLYNYRQQTARNSKCFRNVQSINVRVPFQIFCWGLILLSFASQW